MKININIGAQQLDLLNDPGRVIKQYLISSAKNGTGQENGSFCTPLGKHVIRAKIGAGQAVNTVFIKRRPTGEIYSPVCPFPHYPDCHEYKYNDAWYRPNLND